MKPQRKNKSKPPGQANTRPVSTAKHLKEIIPHADLLPDQFRPTAEKDKTEANVTESVIALETFESVEKALLTAKAVFHHVDHLQAKFLSNDEHCKERTTAEGIWSLLKLISKLMQVVSTASPQDKNELHFVIYNCSVYVLNYKNKLKLFWFSDKIIDMLKRCVELIESCEILRSAKFLEWRIKLYLGILTSNCTVVRRKRKARGGTCLYQRHHFTIRGH